MSSRLCAQCNAIFDGPRLKELMPHHESWDSVLAAAQQGCYICYIVAKNNIWIKGRNQTYWFMRPCHRGSLGHQNASYYEVQIDGWQPMSTTLAFQISSTHDTTRNYVAPVSPESPEVLDLGYRWYLTCRDNHKSCRVKDVNVRPTRLLEILDQNTARVILTQEEVCSMGYATLSHCWGKSIPLRLLTSNILELQTSVEITRFPASYREAIMVCRRFGLKYLWIDSLCIVQDSTDDWEREAAAMTNVYGNSMLNICTAGAAESSEPSFASRDVAIISPAEFQARWGGQDSKTILLRHTNAYQMEVSSSPLFQRAWVVQEVMLASRLLVLAENQLWWE